MDTSVLSIVATSEKWSQSPEKANFCIKVRTSTYGQLYLHEDICVY